MLKGYKDAWTNLWMLPLKQTIGEKITALVQAHIAQEAHTLSEKDSKLLNHYAANLLFIK